MSIPTEFWHTFGIGCAAETAIIVASIFLSPPFFPKNYPNEKQWLWHTTASAIFPAVAVAWFALPGTLQLWTEKNGVASVMMAPPNPAMWSALGFALAHFSVDGLVMAVKSKTYMKAMKKPLYLQMMAHHLVSVAFWPIAFLDSRCVLPVGYFMSTEVTNIWLNSRWFLGELKLTGTFVTIWNVMFFVSYTLVRVATIPAALWVAYSTDWSTYIASTSARDMCLTLFCVVPFMLNLFWYSLILKAAKKTLAGKGS